MNIYSHLLIADLRDGIDKLPDYSQIQEKARATGTADLAYTPSYTEPAQDRDNFHPLATNKPVCTGKVLKLKNPVFDTKNSRLDTENRALSSMKVLGFEPKTYGLKGRCPENISDDKTSTYDSGKTTGTHPGTQQRAPEARIDPDLQAIIDHWKDLPEHIRQTIKTIAETAGAK